MIRYKTLIKNGNYGLSLTSGYQKVKYPLPQGNKPGKWIWVPSDGAYVSELGGDLFAGGYGDILAELECEEKQNIATGLPRGVNCYKKVRVRKIIPWAEIPEDQGKWRYFAARDIECLAKKERRELVMGISEDQGEWRYFAARDIECLAKKERRELVMGIPKDQGEWRYFAAHDIECFTDEERRELVMGIPKDQGEWRCLAARDIKCLTDKERRELVMGISVALFSGL